MKRNATIKEQLNFSDVLLLPGETNIKPGEVSLKSRLTKSIELNIPLVAAGSDNVTESPMAITIAQAGGLGVIHDNMPLGKQVEEVRRVKRAEGEIVQSPITVSPESSVAEALDLMTTYKISGLPVIEQPSQKVVGIITNRDLRFFEDFAKPVSELMTKQVVTVKGKPNMAHVKQLLHEHRIEKIVVTDDQGKLTGLVTVKDIEKLSRFPAAARDQFGRLRVGAAIAIGKDALDRAAAMTDAGLDVVFIDVAHGHTKEVAATVSRIRQQRSSEVQIVAGNVATANAARSLIDAGADAIKVGMGPMPGAVLRGQLGIGVPQFSAILAVVEQCEMQDIPVLVDGGVEDAGALVKALAAGAESVVMSHLFAGTDEAPGEVVYQGGNAYKVVNPMAKAQHRPSHTTQVADPYRIDEDPVDTSVPYRGSVTHMVNQLVTGLRTSMAYLGAKDLRDLREYAEFVRAK
ncbi:MAG TPA: IMP dehydrogenase [Patescibacteria group bacterium]|nr:IMP dehydrogenase [Patescibacteria group bacterium]